MLQEGAYLLHRQQDRRFLRIVQQRSELIDYERDSYPKGCNMILDTTLGCYHGTHVDYFDC